MRAPGSRIVRLGLIGCGAVAERGYLPALAEIPDAALVAVADPVADRRSIAADAAGYQDAARMLSAERLDGVLVCSPPQLHLEHATACARAGLPALVEKPPGLARAEALGLASLQPPPLIGFNRRFAHGQPIAVREPTRMTAVFDAPPGDWHPGHPAPDPLIDLGCHLVDLCLWVSGAEPLRARAMPMPPSRAAFELELSGGLRLYGECGAASVYRELLEVRNDRGEVASWSWPESAVQQLAARVIGRPIGLLGSWRSEVEAFAGALRGEGQGRLARADEAVLVMAVLEAAAQSAAAAGRWISVA